MSLIPIITARQMLAVLFKAGFKILRQVGSHIRLQHPVTKKVTMVAMHTGDLSRKIITTIIKQAGLSVKDFLHLLK